MSTGTSGAIVIGIVNNMPKAAAAAAQKQFHELVADAAGELPLTIRMFSPTGHAAPPANARHEPADALWASRLDGLIVTGTEPQTSSVADEPCWPFLSRLADWAQDNTLSSVWSCLAAHAAVYRFDGIERRELEAKLFGVYDCEILSRHEVLDGCGANWPVPHSRYNDLERDALVARGYTVIARSPDAGIDSFLKQTKGLHFFLQGHPEYDAESLAREYRRDVRRFLARERERYPDLPANYFAPDAAAALLEFRRKAISARSVDILAEYPSGATARISEARWRPTATRFYRNWLSHLWMLKKSRMGRRRKGTASA